jgi:CelD/BcsL family acetyltransferase involved in cellulose biosynthesis
LTRKFKANLRNRERRLNALGETTLEVVKEGGPQSQALQIFYELEASGWKGEGGTAVVQHPSVKAFYDRLVDRSADLWVPILRVGGRPVAAQVVPVRGRTMFIQKTAYDREFSSYAPGQILTARLIRYGIKGGMEAIDFLGENMIWKADWAPRLRQHFRLVLFSPSLNGRYGYWTRYALRERAKQVPGLPRLVRWLRAQSRGSD